MSSYLPQAGRRKFFKVLGGILAAPFLVVAGMAIKKTEQNQGKSRIILPAIPEGISFHGAVITIRTGKKVRVLSSSCTHLGCRIQSTREGHLQCPCHGSEFSGDGSVLKGPADRPLTSLHYKTDPVSGQFTIYLNRNV
ncbi:MAG: Rieske (2Fe-2S) protein [Bacteroidales bacterium]|nr:Rieske (2Fe-2S) protein [Bacteroidales bacterium]